MEAFLKFVLVSSVIVFVAARPEVVRSVRPGSLDENSDSINIADLSDTSTVVFYDEDQFKGSRYTIFLVKREGECYTLPNSWWDRADSVNTNNACIHVFSTSDCTGKSERIEPGTRGGLSLSNIKMDNDIRSVSQCKSCQELVCK